MARTRSNSIRRALRALFSASYLSRVARETGQSTASVR